jgi:hypothetical protein
MLMRHLFNSLCFAAAITATFAGRVCSGPVWPGRAQASLKTFVNDFIVLGNQPSVLAYATVTDQPGEYWNIAQALDTLTDGGAGYSPYMSALLAYQSGVGWLRNVGKCLLTL